MDVTVTRAVVANLLMEADRHAPQECCGILLGGLNHINLLLPAPNVADRPDVHFEIDPAILLHAHRRERQGGAKVIGYYHSHPTGSSAPSDTDCEHSTGDLRVWAIIAAGQVAFWRDTGNGFAKLEGRVVGADPAAVR